MADIKLVIKINENTWKRICDSQSVPDMLNIDIVNGLNAIRNGTPLPKGHGRLMILSEDRLKENQINLDMSCQKWISEVGLSNATVAIIEADKE